MDIIEFRKAIQTECKKYDLEVTVAQAEIVYKSVINAIIEGFDIVENKMDIPQLGVLKRSTTVRTTQDPRFQESQYERKEVSRITLSLYPKVKKAIDDKCK